MLLDPRLLLGDLLAHPTAKWIGFELGAGGPVHISRAKLRATRSALRSFADLTCWLDCEGLHFRWRGGKGGLNLFSQAVQRHELGRVLKVPLVLASPAPAVVTTAPAAPPTPPGRGRPRSGAWLGEILGDLGLLG